MPESAIVGDPLVIDQSRDRSLYGGGGEVDAFDDGVGNRTRHLLAASGGPAHEVTGHGVGVDRTERNGLGHAVWGGAMHVDKLLHHVMATAGDDEQHLRVAVGKPFEGVRQFGAKVDDGVELVEASPSSPVFSGMSRSPAGRCSASCVRWPKWARRLARAKTNSRRSKSTARGSGPSITPCQCPARR